MRSISTETVGWKSIFPLQVFLQVLRSSTIGTVFSEISEFSGLPRYLVILECVRALRYKHRADFWSAALESEIFGLPGNEAFEKNFSRFVLEEVGTRDSDTSEQCR